MEILGVIVVTGLLWLGAYQTTTDKAVMSDCLAAGHTYEVCFTTLNR